MCGQDRPDREPGDQRVQLGVRPADPAEPGDRVGDRTIEDPVARRALAAAQRADAAARLGEVDQAEVERERGDDGLGRTEIERSELLVEPGPFDRIVVASEGDGPVSDPLDGREQLRTGLLRDDLAEQGAEQADLGRQRVARAAEPIPSGSAATAGEVSAAFRGLTQATLRSVPAPIVHPAATFETATFP